MGALAACSVPVPVPVPVPENRIDRARARARARARSRLHAGRSCECALVRSLLAVQAALLLLGILPPPSAFALVLAGHDRACARLAADTDEPSLV
jgi:hypothetical protein